MMFIREKQQYHCWDWPRLSFYMHFK